MLNQPKPREFRTGTLHGATRDAVAFFDVGEIRHQVVMPLQFEKYPRCGMLLIAIAGEEHFDYLGHVLQLSDPPGAEFDFGWFYQLADSPPPLHM